MRSAASLISLVREIVDEPVSGLSDPTILASLNEALGLIAEKLTPTTLVVAFEAVDLMAGDDVVPLSSLQATPVTQKVLSIHGSDKKRIKIFKRIADAEALFARDLTPGQDPTAVLVSNNQLVLIPPVNQISVIYVSYIRKPDLYANVEDTGAGIVFVPDTLGEKFLVNYAAAMAYRKIEDGVTDSNGNFKLYYELAMSALAELELFFGPEAKQSRPDFVPGAEEIVGTYQANDPFLF